MFEITYNDEERLEQYKDAGKVYPDAVYDFTFEHRFLICHFHATHELHYVALDMKTGLSSEICRRKETSPVTKDEHKAMIPKIFESIRYTGSRRYMNRSEEDPVKLIDSIFRVILPNYGYAIREEQITLAKMMYSGLTEKQVSINEAEVGTGKTLAYLIASLVAKWHNNGTGSPVTITTANIELQNALVEKEIPALSRCLMDYHVIHDPLVAVLRKGKEHYFCRKRFNDFLKTLKQTPSKYQYLIDEFEKTEFELRAFDLDKHNLRPSLKERICVKGSCRKCPYASECRYARFIKSAMDGDGIDYQVTNHNLYLTSQKLRGEFGADDSILLPSDYIIVDEAHKLKETAMEVFGFSLSEKEIPAFVKAVFIQCKDEDSRKEYHEMLDELLGLNSKLFSHLKVIFKKMDEDDDQETLTDLSQEDSNIISEMVELLAEIASRCKIKQPVKQLMASLKSFHRTNNINIWVEADDNGVLSLCNAPKNIGEVLFRKVWNGNCSHVLTSGTMSDGSDFSFFIRENGISHIPSRLIKTTSMASPFDYQQNTRLFIPPDMPFPDTENEEYIKAIADRVVSLVYATNGHAAVMFTSYKVLNAVYELTKDRLSSFDIFCMTRSNRNAISDFKKSRNGVIFASGSMWEGVDCIGDILSSVIIVKLPFPRRSATMEQKKMESEDVHDFIQRYAVPEMLIKLRQGIGRLIRSETDTGLVSILDTRTLNGAYKNRLNKVLMKYPRVETIEEIEDFFKTVKPETYFSEVENDC